MPSIHNYVAKSTDSKSGQAGPRLPGCPDLSPPLCLPSFSLCGLSLRGRWFRARGAIGCRPP